MKRTATALIATWLTACGTSPEKRFVLDVDFQRVTRPLAAISLGPKVTASRAEPKADFNIKTGSLVPGSRNEFHAIPCSSFPMTKEGLLEALRKEGLEIRFSNDADTKKIGRELGEAAAACTM